MNNGLHDGLNFSEKNKLRVFNPASIFVFVMGLAYTVVGFLIHFPLVGWVSFISAAMAVLAMELVRARRYHLAYNFMMVFGLLYIGVFVVLFGLKINTYLFLLFIPVACSIFFDTLNTTVKYFIATLAMIIFSIWYSNNYPPVYSNEMLNSYAFSISNAMLSATLIFLGVRSFKTENVNYSVQLENKNAIIEEKNKNITDSINYARRIQYTLLARDAFLKQHLPEHFVLFKPKDIVSGDFYWAIISSEFGAESSESATAGKEFRDESTEPTPGSKAQEKQHHSTLNPQLLTKNFYLGVCDSTGHGVPGAFMSLLNSSFLNEAISEKNIQEPHHILNYVRQRLIESISQEGGKDGMDGVLMRFEFRDKSSELGSKNTNREPQLSIPNSKLSTIITYSAANNAPIIIRDNTILELPKDKMPVGQGEKNDSFTLQTIASRPGDMLYLYTDGYADQFGGPKGKKFKYKQLNEFLLSVSKEPLSTQKEKLNAAFESWKGSLEQVDDVCLIGIRF